MQPTPNHAVSSAAPTQPEPAPRVDSHLLLRGHRTLEIAHGEQRYMLRVTKDNKLILTK